MKIEERLQIPIASELDIWTALQALLDWEETEQGDLQAWTDLAQQFDEQLATSNVHAAVDHEVWHYLSDFDIRKKDAEYARIQMTYIKSLIVSRISKLSSAG